MLQDTAAQGDVARPYLGMTILYQHGSQTADTRHGLHRMTNLTKARPSGAEMFGETCYSKDDPWYTTVSPSFGIWILEGHHDSREH